MRWSLESVVSATGGALHAADSRRDGDLTGVSNDSRHLTAGQLFVALRAERDGHEFIPAAIHAGAGAVLVEAAWAGGRTGSAMDSVPVISVEDSHKALLALGRVARDRLAAAVVAITGSVGKTSTKDLTASALAASLRTSASEKSFNNEIGVPLTLVNAAEETEVCVIEMGTRGPGQLALLCEVARPTIGVVTAVAAAHTAGLGDLDAVAAAKAEVVMSLPPSGIAILNADDNRVARMGRLTTASVLTYSADSLPGADVVAERVDLDDQLRPSFVARTPWGDEPVTLEARGAHQVGNALAALAVAGSCGVPLAAAAAALRRASMSPWRMDLRRAPSGAWILNDAYNANPASMSAALSALADLEATRHIAVLGIMAELGDRSRNEHLAVAELAGRLGVELIAVGTPDYGVRPAATLDDAVMALGALGARDAVLVKGSRVAGMERLAERLLDVDTPAG